MLIGVVQSSNNITVSFNLSTTSFECVNDFEWFKRCYFYIPVSCVSSTFYNIGLLCCSLTCYVRIQVLYASNYVIWIPAFFGYHVSFVFVSSCILASSIRKKTLLYINSNISWGFDYIHKYIKMKNEHVEEVKNGSIVY